MRTHILFADPGGSARQKIVYESDRSTVFCSTVLLHALSGVNGVIPGYGEGSGHVNALLGTHEVRPRNHWRPETLLKIADIQGLDGSAHPLCSRSILKASIEAMRAVGRTALVGLELEFYLIPESLSKHVLARRWSPRSLPRGMYGSLDGTALVTSVLDDILAAAERCELQIETIHREFENMQYEFTFAPADPLKAADDALIFRELARSVAVRQGVNACFMPKPFAVELGSGMHINISRRSDVLTDASEPASGFSLSRLAGVASHFPACCVIWNPTVNSYRRLNGADFNSISSPVADERRDTLLRVVTTSDSKQKRLEFRLPDAACNPYTSLALCLVLLDANALDADGAGAKPDEVTLPSSLAEAVTAFHRDPLVSKAFPSDFTAAFLEQKAKELEFYRSAVPDIDFLLQMPQLYGAANA